MSVNYITRLDESQLLALVKLLTPEARNLSIISEQETCFLVEVESPIDVDGAKQFVSDRYTLTDYDLAPYDWGGDIHDEVIEYRRMMYEDFGFGEDYALDFLFDVED